MSKPPRLLTAEEFADLRGPGNPQELVCGVVIDYPYETALHGGVCANVGVALLSYCKSTLVGHATMRIGVITRRNPDTVRGSDVTFISYSKLPKLTMPDHYLAIPPDAVFDVVCRFDSPRDTSFRVADFLGMGVPAVYVVDPEKRRVSCNYLDRPPQILFDKDTLSGIGFLAGFQVAVQSFFE